MTIYFYKNFVLLKVRVLPRSSKNEIMGEMADGALKVKLTAAPVDGKANEALISLLTEHFNCPKTKIKIVRGQTSKNKVIEILNTKQQMLNKIWYSEFDVWYYGKSTPPPVHGLQRTIRHNVLREPTTRPLFFITWRPYSLQVG